VKITQIETIPVQVPIQARLAIRSSIGAHSVSPFLLVKIHTDEGIVGLGEFSGTLRWSGEDQVTAAHFIAKALAPQLEGENPLDVARLSAKMQRALARNPFTKAALEMALWDIVGKTKDLPLYRVLGGPLREFVPTKWSVSGVEPEQAAGIAAWAVEQGFRAMKVKVGLDPDQDVARVRAVREAVGPDVRIGVDANGGWTPAVAVETIQRLYEYDIYFAEQPVAPGDPEEMAEVRRQIRIPVMADESVYTAQDAAVLARAGAADLFSIYVGKSGGIGPAQEIATVAKAAGLACTVGSNLELGVGSAAMIHLAMATPGIAAEDFPCDIIGPLYYEAELLSEPLRISGGQAHPPHGPGLGVELNEKAIARFRVS
jgi:L-alanine-DL-glutamate epimerase-like enolase superfamily enzyme